MLLGCNSNSDTRTQHFEWPLQSDYGLDPDLDLHPSIEIDYFFYIPLGSEIDYFATIGPSSEIDYFSTKISSEIEYPSTKNNIKELLKNTKMA